MREKNYSKFHEIVFRKIFVFFWVELQTRYDEYNALFLSIYMANYYFAIFIILCLYMNLKTIDSSNNE